MADKSFTEYLAESVRDYEYILKLAVDDVTAGMKDILEDALGRYELLSASDFKKTPIQESPLDFPNIQFSSVYIAEIKLGYPGGRDFLETYIASSLGLTENRVVVYSDNDPRQLETELHLERSDPNYKADYKPVMGTENEGGPTDAEVRDIYGKGQVTNFLRELETVRNDREVTVVNNALSTPPTNDPLPADHDNFTDEGQYEVNSKSVIFGRERRRG